MFKIEKIKSVSVTSTNTTNGWSISRETEQGDWKLAQAKPGEELDKSKVSGVGNVLSSPSFNDVVLPDKNPDELGFAHPTVANIETFDHLTYKVSIGGTNNEGNYYLKVDVAGNPLKERTPGKDEKPEDKAKLDKEFKEANDKLQEKLKKEEATEKWTYVISKWTIDPLLKERKDLIAEKKEESASSSPSTPSVSASSTPTPGNSVSPGKTTGGPPPLLVPDPHVKPPPLPENKEGTKPKTATPPQDATKDPATPTEKPADNKPSKPDSAPSDAKPADSTPTDSKTPPDKKPEPALPESKP